MSSRDEKAGVNMSKFKVHSAFEMMGDQPQAVEKIAESIESGNRFQTLLGVTGSGKTYTMAKIIEKVKKPTLISSHNKTLAAQLHGEMKEFFPENSVEYFVSYYDFYQPEAYVASTDTYIEKAVAERKALKAKEEAAAKHKVAAEKAKEAESTRSQVLSSWPLKLLNR